MSDEDTVAGSDRSTTHSPVAPITSRGIGRGRGRGRVEFSDRREVNWPSNPGNISQLQYEDTPSGGGLSYTKPRPQFATN